MEHARVTGSYLARLDGCPACIVNAELPYGLIDTPSRGQIAVYRCTDCGHRWHTSWHKEAAA